MRLAIVSALLIGAIFSISACPSERTATPLERRNARFAGTVSDELDKPAPGVEVRVGGQALFTDEHGRFVAENVPEGSLLVEVRGAGRAPRVFAARAPNDSFALKLGAAGDTQLLFTGDVMFARRYLDPSGDGSGRGALADARDPSSFAALVRHVAPLTTSADVTAPNVETAFGWGGTAHPSKPFVFISPPAAVAALHALGADVALLANNHTYDYFDEGMRSTLDVLHGATVQTVGAGMNEGEAYRPLIVTQGKFRLGIAPFCGLRICGVPTGDGMLPDEPPYQDAIGEKAGVARLSEAKLVSAVNALRPGSDRVAVVLHSGNEYQRFPTVGQQNAAHRALDLGADFVVGHHPHVLQPLEVYRGKLIAYSLGNLVFDQDFRETWSSGLLRIDAGASLSYRVDPIWLEDFVPHAATGRLARWILRDLAERSAPLGATVLDDGRVLLSPPELDEETVVRDAIADSDGHGATLSLEAELTARRYLASAGPSSSLAIGRDVLGVGNFEHDLAGAPYERIIGWNPVSSSQQLVSDTPHEGARALRICRDVTSSTPSGLYSAGRQRVLPGRTYSFCGCARGHSMSRAHASIVYWSEVAADAAPLASISVLDAAPSEDWSCFCAESTPPQGAQFVNVRLETIDESRSDGCKGPDIDAHCVDWDGVRLVEWTRWDGTRMQVPNAIEFLRTEGAGPVAVTVARTRTTPKEGP